ncbi:MAG: protein kinase [Gemmatimonadaceae bacterium]
MAMPPTERSDLRDRLQSALGAGYRVEQELQSGGMSRLFLATDLSLLRPVAVKVLPPDLAGEVNASRFQREIAVTAHFQHPHIIPILSAGAHGSLLYYTMPFVDGESLQQRMSRPDEPLPAADAYRLLAEVADALAYAHAHGVVHRDVKPSNIMLSGDHAVLVDFGVAQAMSAAVDGEQAVAGLLVGTRQYMAPEQFTGSLQVDGRADIYSLGVVLYEVLTGKLPDDGYDLTPSGGRRSAAKTLSDLRPDVPRELDLLVRRALASLVESRLATAEELRDGLARAAAAPSRPTRLRNVGIAAVIVAALVALALLWKGGARPTVDDDRVAIAPFEVMLAEHALWREGFVDLLSAKLDGAGPLRTVPPSVVVRVWQGPADVESAVAFGRRTGARFVVLGHVLPAGRDSARISAWLVDVLAHSRGEPIEFRDATDRMDRMADSLTLALLRGIGAARPMTAVRRGSMNSTSLPAIRAFLQGEQYLRRTEWDSALAAYARAVELDSTFALAHSHLGITYGWQRYGTDSLARVHALRAGALNVGLGTRDSLLIAADSLRSVAYGYGHDPQYRSHVVRLFGTLRRATERNEQDAEAWYRLGDAYFHFGVGPGISVSEQEILRTFDRSITLDSAFAPAYIHPVELGFSVGDSARALRYAHRYFALRPTDVSAAGTLLAARLLAGTDAVKFEARVALDTASADLLFQAYSAARRALDQRAVAVALLQAMTSGRQALYAPLANPAFARVRMVRQLAYRGRFREAMELPEARESGAFAEMALAGGSPALEARRVLSTWLRSDPRDPQFGTPGLVAAGAWWARQRDTTSLLQMARVAEGAAHGEPAEHRTATYTAAVAAAYLALARADTTDALRRFAALPDSLCEMCAVARYEYASVLSSRSRLREAAVILADRPTLLPSAIDVLWSLERARVAERLGDLATARQSYAVVVAAWSGGDDELARIVDEARRASIRLGR